MIDTPYELPSTTDVFTFNDSQRRLALVKGVLPLFLLLDFVGLIIFIAYTINTYVTHSPTEPRPMVLVLIFVGILVLYGFFAWAFYETKRPNVNVNLTTNLTCLGTTGTVIVTELSWYIIQGLDPQVFLLLTTFGVAIVLAGMLNGRQTVIITTLVLNVVSIGIITHALTTHMGDEVFTHEGFLIIGNTLFHQWTFTMLLIIVQKNYRELIVKLGNERYARERAEKLDDLKDQFIHNVNHELRNPIMVLLAYHEALKTFIPGDASPTYRNYIDKVSDTGLALRNLVQRVLDLDSLDQTKPSFVPQIVNVYDAVHNASSIIDPQDVNRSLDMIHIEISDDMMIFGDTILLQQIIVNLLSNALKYSPPSTPISITASIIMVRSLKKGERSPLKKVELLVRDYGHGIPPSQLPFLFHRFVRLPRDLASNVHGSGLGLYISLVLAQAMDGDITVTSSGIDGDGTTFCVTLPVPQQ